MIELYELAEPFDSGMLEVGDGNSIYWEAAGNAQGKVESAMLALVPTCSP